MTFGWPCRFPRYFISSVLQFKTSFVWQTPIRRLRMAISFLYQISSNFTSYYTPYTITGEKMRYNLSWFSTHYLRLVTFISTHYMNFREIFPFFPLAQFFLISLLNVAGSGSLSTFISKSRCTDSFFFMKVP